MDDSADLHVAFEARLAELQVEHRDLDMAIHRLAVDPLHNQLALRRMPAGLRTSSSSSVGKARPEASSRSCWTTVYPPPE